jgi:PAS domain S-box-containing protein
MCLLKNKKIISSLELILSSIFLLALFNSRIFAQEKFQAFYLTSYNKLPTNFVKSAIQDSVGFIWFATDNGLARYDGEDVEIFEDPYGSKYIKNLHKRNGDIYVLADDGISIVKFIDNKHKVIPFIGGSSDKKEDRVFFPKEIFFDRNNNIWIGEPTSILKVKDNKFKRYPFGREDFTQSYSRSFNFLEDKNGKVIISSQRGNIFFYDEKSDRVVRIPFNSPFKSTIDALLLNKNNQIIAGGSLGLFEIFINDDYSQAAFSQISDLSNISTVKENSFGEYFIGSWSNGLYYSNNLSKGLIKLSDCKFDIISNIYISDDQTLWISSDEGVAILKKIMFGHSLLSNEAFYIQNINKNIKEKIVASDGNSVFEISIENGLLNSKKIFEKSQSLIRSIYGDVNNLWVGFSDGFVVNAVNGKTSLINFQNQFSGDNVIYYLVEFQNNIWGILGRSRGLFKIDNSYNFKLYNSFKEPSNRINIIKRTFDDNLYLGCQGIDSYLYKYNKDLDTFENISKPINFIDLEHFEVQDLEKDKFGNLWLATNIGLIKYSDNSVEYVEEVNSIVNPSFLSIAIDKNNNLWIGSERGFVFFQNKNSFTFFNENLGIPNATNTFRSIAIDKGNNIIFGTAKGIVYQKHPFDYLEKTSKPMVFRIEQNEHYIAREAFVNLEHGQTLSLRFNSFVYPKDRVLYQYRILNLSEKWSEPSAERELILAELNSGKYTLEIRAIELGKAWSDVVRLQINVEKPFYLSFYAITFYLFITGFLFIFTKKYLDAKREKNKFKEQLNYFFKVSNHLLFITDSNWNLIYVNPFGVEFLGLEENLSDKKFWEIFPENFQDDIKEKLKELNPSSSKISFVSVIKGRDDKLSFYQFNVSKSSDGKLYYINASDVSELKELELRLQELNYNKDKLFSIIAHDLKGPFLGLQSLSELIIENYQSLTKEEGIQTLKKLNSSISKTFNLIKNLLDWSQLQLNSNIFSPEEINVKSVTDNIIKILSPRIEEKNISIINHIDENHLVKADKTMLNSILLNLLSNSIKFSKPGGEVIINSKELNNGFLEVSVKDYGIGIPDYLKEKLFKISEKVSRKGTMGEESSGLGLILCKEFVEKNGGEIRFVSQENVGTTFYFTLPLAHKTAN